MGNENGSGEAKPRCFVISEIGEAGTPQRKRADQVLKYIIQPTLSERFDVFRADGIDEPGVITAQIVDAVVHSELVVADLTNHNPNVFYELALRHAVRKPFIQIYDPSQKIPFDVAQGRSIPLDVHELDSVVAAMRLLSQQADAVMREDHQPESLLSVAIDLEAMRSGTKTERVLGDILGALEDLRLRISRVERPNFASEYPALAEEWRKRQDARQSPGVAYGEKPGGLAEYIRTLDAKNARKL